MTYRVQSGRPIQHKDLSELGAVHCALRERDEGFALAMTFDPGDAPGATLGKHAIDIMLNLMFLRGWRHDGQVMRMGLAREWPDRWWAHALGPHALAVESDLARAGATDPDDIERIASLTKVAWCMERELYLAERPIPDLMTAFAPGGLVLASSGRGRARHTRRCALRCAREAPGSPRHRTATSCRLRGRSASTPARRCRAGGPVGHQIGVCRRR